MIFKSNTSKEAFEIVKHERHIRPWYIHTDREKSDNRLETVSGECHWGLNYGYDIHKYSTGPY